MLPAERIFVVVGTDSGVGKTIVGSGLARAWAEMGLRVVAVKPVETGCDGADFEDGVLLAQAARQETPVRALRRLRTAIAPPQAAEVEGETLDFDELLAATRDAIAGAEIALVESAGGLLSPFTAQTTAIDLAEALGARVILVSADRLGTQNHTRLTLRALGELPLAAVVLSTAEPSVDASAGRNAAVLRADVAPLDLTLDLLPPVTSIARAATALTPLARRLADPA